MLTEFALTPQVFDANAADVHWLRHLTELARGIFPMDRKQPVPVIVSNFQAGEWIKEALTIIKGIRGMDKRIHAESLLTKLKDILVYRPAIMSMPTGEAMWIKEALKSFETAPFSRLLTTNNAGNGGRDRSEVLFHLANVANEGFWDDICSPWHPRPVIGEQIEALSALCLHAGFLAFVSPRMRGEKSDDLEFARELAQKVLSRHRGFATPIIDIHTDTQISPRSSDFAEVIEQEAEQILEKLSAGSRGTGMLRLFLWPKCLERVLIAGSASRDDRGQLRLRARWAVSFTHVARRTDRPDGVRHTWTLMGSKIRDDWYAWFYDERKNELWPKIFQRELAV